MPVVKRTIVVGEWYLFVDSTDKKNVIRENRMRATGTIINDYLLASNIEGSWPVFDRASGTATYTYSQKLVELAKKYPIYSMSYVVTLNDEIGTVGSEANEPPVSKEPENMRALTFEMEDGITSKNLPINVLGNTMYTPSSRNFSFTVESSKAISVTTNRHNKDIYTADGVEIKENKDKKTYSVTIYTVREDINIKVAYANSTQSEAGDGTTGTDGPTSDAVWASGGTLYVNAATPGVINIYSITGQLYKTEAISGSYTLSLAKGLYIIQLNGKAYKVVL